MDPLLYFWLMLKAALLSSGGMGNLPSLHQDFLMRRWATDQQFAGALLVGQVAPGPNGLWVVALGVVTAGWWGAILATIAIVIPPLLIIPLGRLHGRFSDSPTVHGFTQGLALAVCASVPVVFLKLVSAYGVDLLSLVILVASVFGLASRRIPLIVMLGLGAAGGALFYRA